MSKYGEALQRIIASSGISKNSLHTQGVIDRNVLNTTIREIENPGVETIERYLAAFNANWNDWAKAMEEVNKKQRSAEHLTSKEPKTGSAPKKKSRTITGKLETGQEVGEWYCRMAEFPHRCGWGKTKQDAIEQFYLRFSPKKLLQPSFNRLPHKDRRAL